LSKLFFSPAHNLIVPVSKPAMIRLPLFDRLFTLNNEGNLARESYKAKDIFNKSDILLSEATDSVRRSGKRISVKPRKLQGGQFDSAQL
jgi:hypothetical protein